MITARRFTAAIFVLIVVLFALLIFRVVNAEPTSQYYSSSIQMDGTYDWQHAMFSWYPAAMPGYAIDLTNINCVGSVRVNLNTWKCVEPYQWYYEPGNGRYYFTATLDMGQLCGLSDVMMQPWLSVYNQNTGAHDVIYGNTVYADFTWCTDVELPIIWKNFSGSQQLAYP